MELWQSLLVALGGNATLLLVLGFLGRSVMSTVLTKDIEKFKAALHQAGIEHQVRFSKLHERRAEVLAEVYKLLAEAYWKVSEFTSLAQWGDPDRKEQYAAAMNAVAVYFRFFDQHRIWLPPDLCEPLEGFARQLRTPAINLGVYLRIERPTEKTLQEQSEVWDKAWQTVEGDIPKLRGAIEAEFRKILGVVAG